MIPADIAAHHGSPVPSLTQSALAALALRHALGDVAQSELLAPRARKDRYPEGEARQTLDLFEDGAR